MISSGLNALATSGATPITLLASNGLGQTNFALIVFGTNPGAISFDNGATWGYVPAATSDTTPTTIQLTGIVIGNLPVLFKRVGSSDVTGIYAWAV